MFISIAQERIAMLSINLNQLPLRTTWSEEVPSQRAHSTFPFLGSGANKDTSLVYFELEPGDHLGRHTDSAEEILLILEGKAEVEVGDERGIVEAPGLALVPTMVPHNIRNIGGGRVKVAGFFPAQHIIATFDNDWLPDGQNVVDTAQIEQMVMQS